MRAALDPPANVPSHFPASHLLVRKEERIIRNARADTTNCWLAPTEAYDSMLASRKKGRLAGD